MHELGFLSDILHLERMFVLLLGINKGREESRAKNLNSADGFALFHSGSASPNAFRAGLGLLTGSFHYVLRAHKGDLLLRHRMVESLPSSTVSISPHGPHVLSIWTQSHPQAGLVQALVAQLSNYLTNKPKMAFC